MKRFAAITLPVALVAALVVVFLLGDALTWRSRVLLRKATGEFDFVTWSETLRWMLPDAPVYLSNLLKTPNPNLALTNTRYVSADDIARGEELFRQNCSGCHGGGGEGVNGPPLNRVSGARSDWSLYRTIQRGVPGTSMPPHELPDPAIWQLMSYLATLSPADAGATVTVDTPPVAYERIAARDTEMDNWLTYSGAYSGQRFSALDAVNRSNAGQLALRWAYQSDTSYSKFQVSPVVADGVMFITEPHGQVTALSADSGEVLWTFDRVIPDGLVLCCGVMNRGAAILGDSVFVTTIDAHLLALDKRSGRLQWEVEVADHTVGYSISAAPLAIDGRVITGVAGGETGIRGFVAAFDPTTGEQVWRFDTVPEPGEPGSETWSNDQWQLGGAATWMTGSYDPELDLVYWGTSHTVHEIDAATSTGDKLYGSSLLALRGATGELVWHFQATPDDIHGFDAAQVPVLADLMLDGQLRRLLFNANRNGYLYTLDRETGEFVAATELARLSWSLGLDSEGRPAVNPDARPTRDGVRVWPNSVGATNWWPPAFDPDGGRLCVPVVDSPSVYYAQDVTYTPGRPYVAVMGRQSFNEPAERFIRCFDMRDGSRAWQTALVPASDRTGPITMTGLLMTAGGILFAADYSNFLALDAADGAELWRVNTGGRVLAPPVTYRVNGEQFVAVASGRSLLVFGLPEQR